MGIFGKRGPSLTLEEKFVADFDVVVAGMREGEIEELSSWVQRYIPVIISQATSQPKNGAVNQLRDFFAKSWKRLIWHAGSPVECMESMIVAVPKYAPNLHRIILEQVQRWREQQAKLQALEERSRGPILEGEIVGEKVLLLEPPK